MIHSIVHPDDVPLKLELEVEKSKIVKFPTPPYAVKRYPTPKAKPNNCETCPSQRFFKSDIDEEHLNRILKYEEMMQ